MENKEIAKRFFLELWEVRKSTLQNQAKLILELKRFCKKANFTILKEISTPNSIFFILAESHLQCFFLEKERYVYIDLFFCGQNANSDLFLNFIFKFFEATKTKLTKTNLFI